MIEIDEMIADAKAEEETREDFKNKLRDGLKDALEPKSNTKVTIDLSEYVTLKQKDMDLDRLLSTIIDALELIRGYSNDYLRLSSEGENAIVNAFKVLYPTAYDNVLAMELSRKEENEGE